MSEGSRGTGKVNLALLLLRVPIGVFFTLAGAGKVAGGVGAFVSHASGTIPEYLPQALGKAYLYAVPWAEIIVGACFVLGIFTRFTGLIASLMLISFTIAATGWRGQGGGPFHTNLILLSVTLAIMMLGPGNFSVDAFWPQRRKKKE
jgi:uncharacterized membrane protein YphA (DoxX/SURF4 family)